MPSSSISQDILDKCLPKNGPESLKTPDVPKSVLLSAKYTLGGLAGPLMSLHIDLDNEMPNAYRELATPSQQTYSLTDRPYLPQPIRTVFLRSTKRPL